MTQPTATFSSADQLNRWNQALLSGDAWRIATMARELAEASAAVDTNFRFTICDKFWKPMGELGGWLMENTGTDPRNDCPTSKLVLQGKTPFFEAFADCRNTMVGVIIETAGMRFPFYVKTFTEHYEKAETTGIAELRGIWDILNYYIIWPTWFLPIQAQPFSHAVFLWALETVLQAMVAECAVRIQAGWNEFINNALSLNPDIRAWFGTIRLALKRDGLGEGAFTRMLRTPMYVVRTNPFLDTSPLVARTVRMESCGAVIKDITRAYGVVTSVDLWLPGDPQPDRWGRLDSPTYLFKTFDRSQIEGPTKTVFDAVLRTVVDIEGSLLGKVLDPFLNPRGRNPALPEGAFEAERLGVNFVAPYAIAVAPDPGQDGNIIAADISHHTPDGWQHIIGGRCVSGDTLVHTADGLLEAKTLDGQEVMTLSRGGVYRTAKWKSYGVRQLFKVTFRNSDEILATANHEWIVTGRNDRLATVDLVGEYVPRVADAELYGQQGYLTRLNVLGGAIGADVEVISVEATDRIETVYCCEEPETHTWVAGGGYLTGNSPKWLNDLINATTAWLIDSIMIVIGFTGIPSDLLAGFLNNSFLAFQLIEAFERRSDVGPYHPAIETFTATASAPYNVETIFAFINKLWDTRGYTSALVKIDLFHGPFALGRDIFKGGLMSLVFRNRTKMLTDYIENVTWRITPTERSLVAQLGDGKRDEAPLAKHQRFVTAIFEEINTLTLAPQSG
jgi:hypothetical protein